MEPQVPKGRPSLPAEKKEEAYSLTDIGFKPADIAEHLDVSIGTVYGWLRMRPLPTKPTGPGESK